jgi:hypothetical protein
LDCTQNIFNSEPYASCWPVGCCPFCMNHFFAFVFVKM